MKYLKRFLLTLFIGLQVGATMFAADLVVADWETPTTPGWEHGYPDGSRLKTTNPNSSGINTSTNVMKLTKPVAAWSAGLGMPLKVENWVAQEVALGDYETFEFMVYSDKAGAVTVRFLTNGSNAQFEVAGNYTTPGQWQLVSLSLNGKSTSHKDIQLIPNPTVAEEAGDFYFDNVKLKSSGVVPPAPITIANWDGIKPASVFGWPNGKAVESANPSVGGINTSANVFKLDKPAGWGTGGIGMGCDVNTTTHPALWIMVYATEAVQINAQMNNGLADTDPGFKKIEKSLTLTAANTWQLLKFDIADNGEGWKQLLFLPITDKACMVYFDNVIVDVNRLSAPVVGFFDDFNAETLNSNVWKESTAYKLAQKDGLLEITANKSGRKQFFELVLDKPANVTTNPVLTFKVKTGTDTPIDLFVFDSNNKMQRFSARIFKSDNLQDLSFVLSDANGFSLAGVKKIQIDFNREGFSYQEKAWIEDFRLCDAAVKSANIGNVYNQSFKINSPGQKMVYIRDITNASSVIWNGSSNLIENVTLSTIDNQGYAKLNFTVKADAKGEETITLTAKGISGFADKSTQFKLSVLDNGQPTIDAIADQLAEVGKPLTVKLKGIGDGDTEDEQTLTITTTSNNLAVVEDISTNYVRGQFGDIILTPKAKGSSTITVKVTDNSGKANNNTEVSFNLTVYENLNYAPTLDQIKNQTIAKTDSPIQLKLTGITDGDGENQELIVSASSSDESAVSVAVDYQAGANFAMLSLTPDPTVPLSKDATVTVTVADKGDNAGDNNGNLQVTQTFTVSVYTKNETGVIADMSLPINDLFWTWDYGALNISKVADPTNENESVVKMQANNRITYVVANLNQTDKVFPQPTSELDLSKHPYMTYEIYPVDNDLYTFTRLFDNVETESKVPENDNTWPFAKKGQWTKITMIFDETLLVNEDKTVDLSRTKKVVFDFHAKKPYWPFSNYTGAALFRNIRIGSAADYTPPKPACKFKGVPDMGIYQDSILTIELTGIVNGSGTSEGCTLTVVNKNTKNVEVIEVSDVNENGTATLKVKGLINTAATAQVLVTVSEANSSDYTQTLSINSLTPDFKTVATINVQPDETFQTINGFGSYGQNLDSKLFIDSLGCTVVRVGQIENILEPVNDNNDPYVLNRESLNRNAFDWNSLRKLKEAGADKFIFTNWSCPSWMKKGLTNDSDTITFMPYDGSEYSYRNNNHLDSIFNEEFAESFVAIYRLFEEEAGIQLYGISLQNESFLTLEYGSMALNPTDFAKLIKVVGKRFELEGINTKFYMPEQYFDGNAPWINAILADEEARKYTHAFACHGYGKDGVNSAEQTAAGWNSLRNLAYSNVDDKKEVWMTESHIDYKKSFNKWKNAGFTQASQLFGGLSGGNASLWNNWDFSGMHLFNGQPNEIFTATYHYSKYIRPGAVRVASTSSHNGVGATAFKNPDGSFVMVVVNFNKTQMHIKYGGGNLPDQMSTILSSEFIKYQKGTVKEGEYIDMPSYSIMTLYSANMPIVTIDQVADQSYMENAQTTPITLTGISNGEGSVTGISLQALSSNQSLITNLTVDAAPATDGTATLSYQLAPNTFGTAQIVVTVSDLDGNKNNMSFTVTVDKPTANIETTFTELTIYPNPVTNELFFTSNKSVSEVAIFDISGKQVIRIQPNAESGQVAVSELPKGIYLVKVWSSKTSAPVVKRIVKN